MDIATVSNAAEYLSIAQAKPLFGLSRSSIYRLMGSGDIQAVKVGRRTHLEAKSIRDFMASRPAATFTPPRATRHPAEPTPTAAPASFRTTAMPQRRAPHGKALYGLT